MSTIITENAKRLLQETKGRTIVAATKYVGPDEIRELYEAGITNAGENRVTDFLAKKASLTDIPVTWHFIGSLQTNKVAKVINEIDCLHSLDRLNLAEEIQKRRKDPLPCFIEVHISPEPSKSGVMPKDLFDLCEKLAKYDKIKIIGLMGMAPLTTDTEKIRSSFALLAKLREEVDRKAIPGVECRYLSMGMSDDYKIAMEEGATHLRLGRILYRNEE